MIDRVVDKLGRRLSEVPVGFKWFVPGLFDGSCCFGGEESAGASFLRRDGTCLDDRQGRPDHGSAGRRDHRPHRQGPRRALSGADSGVRHAALHAHRRTGDRRKQKAKLESLSPEAVDAPELAGEPILAKLTRAPGNGAPIGGLKVVAKNGWFAARPSGTENVYKIYAESFKDEAHLAAIVDQAREIVNKALAASGPGRSSETA